MKVGSFVLPTPEESERLDTFGSQFSHLSPRAKEATKLEKMIHRCFAATGKAPETSSKFYRIGKILGKGAFGKVNLAIHRLSRCLVALKSINKQFLIDDS